MELHVHLNGALDAVVLHKWARRVAPRLPEAVVLPWSGATLRVRDAVVAALAADDADASFAGYKSRRAAPSDVDADAEADANATRAARDTGGYGGPPPGPGRRFRALTTCAGKRDLFLYLECFYLYLPVRARVVTYARTLYSARRAKKCCCCPPL